MNDAQHQGFIEELFGLRVDRLANFKDQNAYNEYMNGRELARKALLQISNIVLRDKINVVYKYYAAMKG